MQDSWAGWREPSRLFWLQCYISLTMSFRSVYRDAPDYVAAPLALLASSVVGLILAGLGAAAFAFLRGKIRHTDDLDNTIVAFFFVAPGIAILGFVSCFSVFMNCHRPISWRVPTFTFALGVTLIWVWGRDWLGVAPFIPGTVAWLGLCWFSSRKVNTRNEHVLQA
jgi:O-antigen/teichoic acid export membrane protein